MPHRHGAGAVRGGRQIRSANSSPPGSRLLSYLLLSVALAAALCAYSAFIARTLGAATGDGHTPRVDSLPEGSAHLQAAAAPRPTQGAMARPVLASAGLPFLYGTAWKKERTTDLVVRAVLAGFRGIDTACQPKHYREDLVGAALASLANDHDISREELWLQTKFTPIHGQDPNDVPYDEAAPLSKQVQQSLERSFLNLGTDYINSLVLHSPLQTGEQTMEVWQVLEEAVDQGRIGQIGISNLYDYEHFVWLHGATRHKPKVLQNRFYSDSGYDKELRAFCKENNIAYQTFWTLTANPHILSSSVVEQICSRLQEATGSEVTPAQVLFKFMIQSGHQPLTGTTSEIHMKQDLASPGLPDLSQQEMTAISGLLV